MFPAPNVNNDALFKLNGFYINQESALSNEDVEYNELDQGNEHEFKFTKIISLDPNTAQTFVEISSTRYTPTDDRYYIMQAVKTPINGLTITIEFSDNKNPRLQEFGYLCGDPIKREQHPDDPKSTWFFDGWFLHGEGIYISW
jgi:hypothetical protein